MKKVFLDESKDYRCGYHDGCVETIEKAIGVFGDYCNGDKELIAMFRKAMEE